VGLHEEQRSQKKVGKQNELFACIMDAAASTKKQ
jgi:hypothetical protein